MYITSTCFLSQKIVYRSTLLFSINAHMLIKFRLRTEDGCSSSVLRSFDTPLARTPCSDWRVTPRSMAKPSAMLAVRFTLRPPGNLRELENCLERLHVLGGAQGGSVELGELAFLDEDLVGVERELAERALALGLDLATLEGALIEAALRLERGNRSAAARRLGISRRVLERRRHPAD